MGWQTNGVFGIGLHKKDRAIFELIQQYFNGIGNINKHGKDYVQYYVSSLKDLAVIIEHFDKYPLLTQKRADFELFKKALELISRKEHLTEEGLTKILSIRASVNNGLSDDLKIAFPSIISVKRPQVELPTYINPYWLAGFISGEGCFSVIYSQSSGYKFGSQVALRFRVTQHSQDAELMKSLVKHFSCGGYYSRPNRNLGDFIVCTFSDISNQIIPLFQEYPIMGVKSLDFADFCKVAELMKEKLI